MATYPNTTSASDVWSLRDVYKAEAGDEWPRLPVGFALSSAVYDSVSFSVASQSTASYGLTFNNDGTKMYVVNAATEIIYQYSLSTAYDISTASYDSVSFNAASQVNLLVDITFNNDGTKMYLIGTDADPQHLTTIKVLVRHLKKQPLLALRLTIMEPRCILWASPEMT
jgi:hypothetical protein